MADTTGFRIRLRVRVAKGLTTEATSVQFVLANKEVTITSQNKAEPLSKTTWIVLGARGFATEEAAQDFGTRLRSILQLAALSSRLGVDVGEDKPTCWVSEDFARFLGVKEHERIAPNIHGLAILPDDDNTRIPLMNPQATVTADPEHFLSALRESGESGDIGFGLVANAVRVLNLALMTSEPLAQIVLTFSAVEELGQNEKWSMDQETLIVFAVSRGRRAGTHWQASYEMPSLGLSCTKAFSCPNTSMARMARLCSVTRASLGSKELSPSAATAATARGGHAIGSTSRIRRIRQSSVRC